MMVSSKQRVFKNKIILKPNDHIPREDIKSPEMLNLVFEIVREMGYAPSDQVGGWESNLPTRIVGLTLSPDGDLKWSFPHLNLAKSVRLVDLIRDYRGPRFEFGDYIPKEEIETPEQLNQLRGIAELQGYRVNKLYGTWDRKDIPGNDHLFIDPDGYFRWHDGLSDSIYRRRFLDEFYKFVSEGGNLKNEETDYEDLKRLIEDAADIMSRSITIQHPEAKSALEWFERYRKLVLRKE